MLTDRTKIIVQLTYLTQHMRACKLGHLGHQEIEIDLEAYLFHAIDNNDDGLDEREWDDAQVLDEDPAVSRAIGWIEGHHHASIDKLKLGYEINSEALAKIWDGTFAAPDAPSTEPAPLVLYRVIKESLQLTTRTRLDLSTDSQHAIRITNVNADVLDEYARQAAQAVIGELGL